MLQSNAHLVVDLTLLLSQATSHSFGSDLHYKETSLKK